MGKIKRTDVRDLSRHARGREGFVCTLVFCEVARHGNGTLRGVWVALFIFFQVISMVGAMALAICSRQMVSRPLAGGSDSAIKPDDVVDENTQLRRHPAILKPHDMPRALLGLVVGQQDLQTSFRDIVR
jgi:hypothetical protein